MSPDLPPLASKVVLLDFANLVQVCWRPGNVKGVAVGPERVFRANLKRKVESLSLALAVPPCAFLLVKDSHPTAKYHLFPGYKACRRRAVVYGERFDPFAKAEEVLRQRGARFIRAPGHEADDAIASVVHHLTTLPGRRNERQVVVVSSDQDLWALLDRPRTRVYEPIRKRFVGLDDLEQAYGIREPRLLALWKAVWGDANDDVPNAAPHQQSRLLGPLAASGGVLEAFLDRVRGEKLDAEQVQVNWKLVRLAVDARVTWDRDEYEF